ncbi:hypothetical protein GXP67_16470 [Rhodocytophaga rosea]|uniref:Uncharacterized protein n=1 Tax=Rhodocytophaga rosea TaxID=2704465 RepID=A0A6C0GJI4_9BACT|nr:hypothetical protein [Rhodocytophaga rosea]QHT68119.1 hypothetical protein GXP67_16470 [Rhodocytophaga rosea]
MNRLLIVLFTHLFLSCSSSKEYSITCSNRIPLNLKHFNNQDENFSIEHPVLMTILPNKAYFKFNSIDTTRLKKENIINLLTVEHYQLKDEQSFDEFYKEIQKRNEEAKTRIQPVMSENLIETTISGRPSKITTIGIKEGNTILMTRIFYIQEKDRIFVVTLGTTDKDYEEIFCQYYPVVKSIKGI